jgi:fructose-1,6-bisphosphatase/inositol monophosphatase family enzyme
VKAAEVLRDRAYRLRSPGSIAVDLCYVACGRFDGMITTRPCRSVDAAAGQLIVTEAGGTIAFGDGAVEDAPLDLSARYDLAAARTASDLTVVREAQEAVYA